jgi:recombinational DNA repair protein (RecF pathway)
MTHTYRDTGIILQKYELGEADSLITLLLLDRGLTRTVAKGVRRLNSRKRGHVELFNQIDALLSQGRNLDILSEASTINSFEAWRHDLGRISLAYYAADITLMLLPEQEPQPLIYQHLTQLLLWLDRALHPEMLVRWYEVQLLVNLGYWNPHQFHSPSLNAIQLLQQSPNLTAEQITQLKLAPQLNQELERLMSISFAPLLERQAKSQSFINQVRDLESRNIASGYN